METASGMVVAGLGVIWHFLIILSAQHLSSPCRQQRPETNSHNSTLLLHNFFKFEISLFFAQILSLVLWAARWLVEGDKYFQRSGAVDEIGEEHK